MDSGFTSVALSASAGTVGITALVMPANRASSEVGKMFVEYPAPAAAKPPSSPATGWRPAALKASAASGGITTNAESAMIEPTTPTNPTV